MDERGLELRLGVVTVSDRASAGQYSDRSGPAIEEYLREVVLTPFEIIARVIEDDCDLIADTLIELADHQGCQLIVTSGGTGPAWRDVTPEATERVCQKMMPGFGELMRAVSLTKVPTAILSRQTAGIRSSEQRGCLIINLPGSPKAIADCLEAVFAAVPYCIELINPDGLVMETNPQRVVAYRPRKK